MGFLNFLKKSKPAFDSSPDDAGLSIPPPPFPQTAPQGDIPPSTFSDLPDFKPFGQDFESAPLSLPEMDSAKDLPSFTPPTPRFDAPQPGEMHEEEQSQMPSFDPQGYIEEPIEEPSMEEPREQVEEEEHETIPFQMEPHKEETKPAPPIRTPTQREISLPVTDHVIRHPHGGYFMKAYHVASVTDTLGQNSERLRKMTVKIKQVEEQDRTIEEWKQQLEGLYRKLLYAEKTIFEGE